MRVSSSFDTNTKLAGVRQAVYDGRDRLGDIQQHGAEFIVRDRLNNIVGAFPTLREAARALPGGAS
jgi:hypothetical protein